MERSSGPRQVGERYLLQCPGGLERIGVVTEAPGAEGGTRLSPLPFEDALPRSCVPGGEWRIGAEERVVRDWAGLYWSAATRCEDGAGGVVCEVEFHRHTPQGERVAYRAFSPVPPEALTDAQLVGVLRLAWDAVQTEGAERRRRTRDVRAVPIEL
jgi:hypothetical protein